MPIRFTYEMVLYHATERLKLRPPQADETEQHYRDFVAEHDPDFIQAHEIRTGRGWDEWTEEDRDELFT